MFPSNNLKEGKEEIKETKVPKLSDFVDMGSHERNGSHNDDSLRKRDVKFIEKLNEGAFKPRTIPNSAF